MAKQYLRAYELIITTASGLSRTIRDLRIQFDITKSSIGYPNLAKITLINPNEDTVSALQKKFTTVVLNAGYKGNLRLLFKGQIRNVFQNKPAQDNLVTFYSGDGEQSFQNSSFNKTFSANVNIQQVLKEVMASFEGVAQGVIEGVSDLADKLRGQTLSGKSADILDTFAEEYGFNWNIQDNEIRILPIDEPKIGSEIVLVNSLTGMIGSPTLTEIGANVTTLLNPNFKLNELFRIESASTTEAISNLNFFSFPVTRAQGDYIAQEINYKGDSREGDWLSSVKGFSPRRSINA